MKHVPSYDNIIRLTRTLLHYHDISKQLNQFIKNQPARNLPTLVNKKGLKLRPMVPFGENLLQLVDNLKSEVNTYKEKIKRREAERDFY
jgi:hypothetical protein